ncbi:glutaredoxin family protein [Neptunicella sp.]|uniref:glutaredoxin family protein n=1 Tax=Neptunicella sp. TaxID=2125986 RepID=UPI003F68BF11
MPISLILYSTEGCHLCEQAKAIIQQYPQNVTLEEVDIAYDDSLFARYGVSIPVVKRQDTQQELNWPFDLTLLSGFLA